MKGKKILITGGGGRLGSAIGKECLMQGAEVILVDNNESALDRVIKCKKLNLDNCLETIVENGCSEEGIINIVEHVKDKVGNIDGFVYGAYPRSKTWGCKLEKLEEDNLFEDLTRQLVGQL